MRVIIIFLLLCLPGPSLAEIVKIKDYDQWALRCERDTGQKCFAYFDNKSGTHHSYYVRLGVFPLLTETPYAAVSFEFANSDTAQEKGVFLHVGDQWKKYPIKACQKKRCNAVFGLSKAFFERISDQEWIEVAFYPGKSSKTLRRIRVETKGLGISFSEAQTRNDPLFTEKQEAKALFDAGECQAFGLKSLEAKNNLQMAECVLAKKQREAKQLFDSAIAKNECDAAETIGLELPKDQSNAIAACRKTKHAAELRLSLAEALNTLNCDLAEKLSKDLGEAVDLAKCRFNHAMNDDNPRRMFLVAAKHDAGNDRLRARLLYMQIIEAFPEDDLAIQAALRLTALKDQERSEQRQKEVDAEIARLRQEAVKARTAAKRAQQQAARRAAAPKPAAPRRNTSCDHVYVNKRFQLIPKAPDNAKKAIGLIFQGGLYGTNYIVRGVNPRTGVATVQSTDTGRSLELRCKSIR